MNKSNQNEKLNKDAGNMSQSDKLKLFSDYGYVDVNKQDYDDKALSLVHIEKPIIGLQGHISKQTLTQTIIVNLKTLYGSRKVYAFQVDIKSQIKTLIHKLIEEEEKSNETQKWSLSYQYRLISTNGLIKEIDPTLSFADEEIKNNFTLILASPYKIFFSDKMRHSGIQVSRL